MTIEAKLDAINAQLTEIVALMKAAPADKPAPAEKPKPTKPVEKAPPAAQERAGDVPATVDYDRDVKPLVLKVSAEKGRDACVALLGKFGVETAKALKPEQYREVITVFGQALAS